MKRLLLIIILTISNLAISQGTFTFDKEALMEWNETEGTYETTVPEYESHSKLEYNEDETMFIHTTPELTSVYYVTSTDHIEGFNQYHVKSDVGNEYLFMFDFEHQLWKILPEPDYLYMKIHVIKGVY